jgi:hypothetical protein
MSLAIQFDKVREDALREVRRMRPVVCCAIALAGRLSEDTRCDEEQEDLLRAVRVYLESPERSDGSRERAGTPGPGSARIPGGCGRPETCRVASRSEPEGCWGQITLRPSAWLR